jgi:hypothetical protein
MPRVTAQTSADQFRYRAKKALKAGNDFQARGAENKAILAELKAEIEAGHKELELTASRGKRKLTTATDTGIAAINSAVESGLRRLRKRRAGTGSKPAAVPPAVPAVPELALPAVSELALVPVLASVPALAVHSRNLTKSLWATARLALNTPKLPPVAFHSFTAREEMKKANVIDAARRYAELHGMTIGVVADWFRDGVNMYLNPYRYEQEFEVEKEKARLSAEALFVHQRKKCSVCLSWYHGMYGKPPGCPNHPSYLDPEVALNIEARLRDSLLLAAATYAVKREEERPQYEANWAAERERAGALQLAAEELAAEKRLTVSLAAAKAIADECRKCASCNDADWMMGSYCRVHERRHAEVYASLIEAQLSLCN